VSVFPYEAPCNTGTSVLNVAESYHKQTVCLVSKYTRCWEQYFKMFFHLMSAWEDIIQYKRMKCTCPKLIF